MSAFVGRTEPLGLLNAGYSALTGTPDGVLSRRAGLALVTGEAGIGKTALLTRFATEVAGRGGTVVWGACWDDDQAPAWWPWTQAIRALLQERAELREKVLPELAAVVPELAVALPAAAASSDAAGRVRVFEAAGRLMARAVSDAPVVVILDDLHWADRSTVDLLSFLARQQHPGALMLVGGYRPGEPGADIAAALADLSTTADLVTLQGLSPGEVTQLVEAVTGKAADASWVRLVHERSGGHPFFARELCQLLVSGGTAGEVPAAVRGVIGRRLARLSGGCSAVLEVAAVAGTELLPDVLADVHGDGPTVIAELVAEASAAGILLPGAGPQGRARFTHDLYRETIYTELAPGRRLDLHHRLATALLRRRERGNAVFPAELARHFAEALPRADAMSAVAWAHAAADADTRRYAFEEAAAHLTRVRSAIADAGQELPDAALVGLLTAEADLRLRAGAPAQARELLDTAWTLAVATGQADLIGAVALGLDRCGARFAMRRTDLVAALDAARVALSGSGTPAEAQVTAAVARQLQHSVPADRPKARPLAEDAVRIARTLDDPATLASCLLAQHDTLWTPGTGAERAVIASEIADQANRAGDPERHAQALLLAASAQLETGSAAFRATFTQYCHVTEGLRQPRHDYLLRTRQAALALLEGDIDLGERLSAEAAELGHAVGDSDTGNVHMSQRLEITRARDDPAELCDLATAAVRWWVGAPGHAHAVAAGFFARAGDHDSARRELDTVLALDDWQADRSYLWSIFVGELTAAAIALRDHLLCQRLLDDLLPVADACAVNGALVCFMGANAHRVGLLYAAIGQPAPARQWLQQALQTHRRLGARAWEAETHAALATLGGDDAQRHAEHATALRTELKLTTMPVATAPPGAAAGTAHLRRVGDLWQAGYQGRTAYLRDAKGLHDLAALLAHPGADLSALELAGGGAVPSGGATSQAAVLDRTALSAYRRRLAELDDDLDTARTASDLARLELATAEREQLLTELRRATRPDGGSRVLGSTASERARKAVTARIRDAIGRITEVLPELGAHLNRTVRTGTTCSYQPAGRLP